MEYLRNGCHKIAAAIVAASLMFAASATALQAGPKQFAYLDEDTGRTFVPLRLMGEYAGAAVDWQPEAERIVLRREGKEIVLHLGWSEAGIGSEAMPLDAPPFALDGATYVPLRFVGTALGLSVEWQKEINAVRIAQQDGDVRLPVVPLGSIRTDKSPIVHESRTFKVGGKSFKAQIITISLMDPRVELDVVPAGGKIGRTEALSSIAERHGAMVAINGAFFDAYTESDIKMPYGWIMNDGEVLNRGTGEVRATFIYDKNNLAEVADGGDMPELIREGNIDGAIQAGPRLVRDGKVTLDVEGERFRDPKILTSSGARSALGITRDHKLMLVTVPAATIPQLAEIMRQAGAWQAMNLDGGASSGLYYNGKYVTTPGRLLSNVLIVKLER
ncbi:MAG: copper amine oxidase [Thermobacillus sp.]|uniref:Copper amine oxidase family protein n=1 Tax=Thermobacillus composti (strain DSM 18247 / JCM 13945 / KWC4) TaxID=717605 RepID=L0EC52_THECK|nr:MULTISPECIES: phosphodiester glycosidase family protein [Thermobacillus]AGA57214.1 copper amine oxidase family protein [Thermobacillus composti KWC4]REK56120.1 MAG: copper amine oxidase [Thermobacillus sp.]